MPLPWKQGVNHWTVREAQSPFSLIFLNPEGNRDRNKVLERVTINSAEELGFRGTWLHSL